MLSHHSHTHAHTHTYTPHSLSSSHLFAMTHFWRAQNHSPAPCTLLAQGGSYPQAEYGAPPWCQMRGSACLSESPVLLCVRTSNHPSNLQYSPPTQKGPGPVGSSWKRQDHNPGLLTCSPVLLEGRKRGLRPQSEGMPLRLWLENKRRWKGRENMVQDTGDWQPDVGERQERRRGGHRPGKTLSSSRTRRGYRAIDSSSGR